MDNNLLDTSERSSDDEFSASFDILNNKTVPIDIKILIRCTKQNVDNIDTETKAKCKILKFDSEWKFEEILEFIENIDQKVYQNLFIIIIESKNLNFICGNENSTKDEPLQTVENEIKSETAVKRLQSLFTIFCNDKPMIFQITSLKENVTKFFYKCSSFRNFEKIKITSNTTTDFNDFPSFLTLFLNGNWNDFEQTMIDTLPAVKNSSLIYRFLRILNLDEIFFESMVFWCAEDGSENDLKAVMNFPICDDYDALNSDVKNYMTLYYKEPEKESVLLNAMKSENIKVFKFLTLICEKMIGQFQYDFQLEISTFAFDKNLLDFLCDLVDICDFPFPKNLKSDSVEHEGFKKIIDERIKFNDAIVENKVEEIEKFIQNHPLLKFIFNPSNCSALHQAVSAKNFQILNQLQSKGFLSPEYNVYIAATNNKSEKFTARELAIQMRRNNVDKAIPGAKKTPMLLFTKSFIHNCNISDDKRIEYKNYMFRWLQEIYKIESNVPHLDTAASCDDLKIIFDFESDSVSNIDMISNGLGLMRPFYKWIFIGAKIMDENKENREERIKGVLIHEIGHYALELNYVNGSKPYYRSDKKNSEIFTKIVDEINKWTYEGENEPDDGCDGTISSVFRHYSSSVYHAELIVRVPQILTEYKNDKEKVNSLEKKYKSLFDFHREHVMEDLKKFNLKCRQDIRKFNNFTGMLAVIKNSKFALSYLKGSSKFMEKHVNIIATNTPSLLLLNIYNHLDPDVDNLIDLKNIFLAASHLKNIQILEDLKEILQKSSDLNVFIDCSKGFDENLKDIKAYGKSNFTFIFPHDKSHEKIAEFFNDVNLKFVKFTWNHLSSESQQLLLQTKVKVSNDLIPIGELLMREYWKNGGLTDQNSVEKVSLNSLNDELFELLVENIDVTINEDAAEEINDMINFEILFMARKLVRRKNYIMGSKFQYNDSSKNQSKIGQEIRTEASDTTFTQDQFLEVTKNKKYIIISDVAGNGKSWMTKFIAFIKRKQRPRKWISRVDLKSFIKIFKSAQQSSRNFSDFMTKCILKLKTTYEVEIFSKMYENGRTCIIFDGFDEIAPNYAEFLINIIKSFEYNEGNQLWIATRDYFEVDLQEILNVDEVYKLEPFTQEDGIELIAKSLILNDSEVSVDSSFENHPKYSAYRQRATDLSKMICDLNNQSIGAPQFYQMIVDVHRDKEVETFELTIYKLFAHFVQIYYERWSCKKGELRKKASVLSQNFLLNFMKLHQFFAMKGSYPHLHRFCDLQFMPNKWPEEEIIACGLLIKRNGAFQFTHETFREFFIAEFLIRILEIGGKYIDEEFCEFLKDAMTAPKLVVVRVFFNENLAEYRSILTQLIPKIAENVDKFDFLLDIYKNKLENLQELWMDYFKSLNYEELKNILFSDKKFMLKIADLCEIFQKFPHFLLKPEDLCDLMQEKNNYGNNFIHIVAFCNKINAIDQIIEYLREIFDERQFEDLFKSKGYKQRNFLQLLISGLKDIEMFRYFWNLFLNLSDSREEFMKFLSENDGEGNNLVIIAGFFATSEIFEFIVKELGKISSRKGLKKLLSSKGNKQRNLLQAAAIQNGSLEFHKCLWKIMRSYFDKSEIMDMTTYIDGAGNNLHQNAIIGKNKEILDLTMHEIKLTVDFL